MLELMIESSVLIVLILLIRKIFTRRVSYRFLYALWGIVALRFLFPATVVDTPFSVMNWLQPVQMQQEESGQISGNRVTDDKDKSQAEKAAVRAQDSEKTEETEKSDSNVSKQKAAKQPEQGERGEQRNETNSLASDTGSRSGESQSNGIEEGQETQSQTEKVITYKDNNQQAKERAVLIWAVGAAVCLGAMLWSNIVLYRRLLRNRKRIKEVSDTNRRPYIYQTSEFTSPCLYGLFHPAIYLPEALLESASDEKLEHMILHERIHYRHRDYIWSFVRILLVSVYWFHPLVWLAASLSKKDAELACDEAVLKCLGEEKRSAYGQMLLEVAANGQKRMLYSVTTMSRRGRNLEKRLRAIQEGRKYSRKVFIPLAILVIVVAGITFTGMSGDTNQGSKNENSVSDAQKQLQNVSGEQTSVTDAAGQDAEERESELTMEQLLAWEREDCFAELTYDDFIYYRNCGPNGDSGIEPGVLTGSLYLSLEYQSKCYEVEVSYYYKNHSIDTISLKNEETREQRIIYRSGSYEEVFYYITKIEDMLVHEDYLDGYISYDVPAKLSNGVCYFDRASYSSGAMRLFLSKEDKKNGVYGCIETPIWSAGGGVTQTYNLSFDEKTGSPEYLWRTYYGNGRYAAKESSITHLKNGELESVSGCAGKASVEGIEFHQALSTFGNCIWYLKPEGKEDTEPDKEKLFPKKVWLACLTKEDDSSGFGYVFFLDADKYSKEDAVTLLRSARILKDGNIAHQTLQRKIEKVVPEAVKNELEKGTYTVLGDSGDETFLLKNDETEPTLRLDFVFENGELNQYRSKEYGFVDSLPEEWITKEEAKELVRKFARGFLGISEEPVSIAAPSGYEDEKMYAAFRDSSGGRYLVQLNHNMLIQYDCPENDLILSSENEGYEAYVVNSAKDILFVRDNMEGRVTSFQAEGDAVILAVILRKSGKVLILTKGISEENTQEYQILSLKRNGQEYSVEQRKELKDGYSGGLQWKSGQKISYLNQEGQQKVLKW